MKAQELRDKIAAVRNFKVLIDNKEIENVVIDIEKNLVRIIPKGEVKEEKKEPMIEVKKESEVKK